MSVSGQLETLRSAVDIWKTVEMMYSGAGSVMRTMETEKKIDATIQGEKTVQQYASELKRLWADLDHYSPLSLKHLADILIGKKISRAEADIPLPQGVELPVRAQKSIHDP